MKYLYLWLIIQFGILFMGIEDVSAQDEGTDVSAWQGGAHSITLSYGTLNYRAWQLKTENLNFGAFQRIISFQTIGPIFLDYEYIVMKNIGIGIRFYYIQVLSHKEYDYSNTLYEEKIEWTRRAALTRVIWHLIENNSNMDLYVGVSWGIKLDECKRQLIKAPPSIPDPANSLSCDVNEVSELIPLAMEVVMGFRLFLLPNFGLHVESGLSAGILNFGITGRF